MISLTAVRICAHEPSVAGQRDYEPRSFSQLVVLLILCPRTKRWCMGAWAHVSAGQSDAARWVIELSVSAQRSKMPSDLHLLDVDTSAVDGLD